jgi:hypothetical protein
MIISFQALGIHSIKPISSMCVPISRHSRAIANKKKGSLLEIVHPWPRGTGRGGMADLSVTTWSDETLDFSFDPLDTVGLLKKSIQEKRGIPVASQHLFQGNREMLDENRLSEYGIVKVSYHVYNIQVTREVCLLIPYNNRARLLSSP